MRGSINVAFLKPSHTHIEELGKAGDVRVVDVHHSALLAASNASRLTGEAHEGILDWVHKILGSEFQTTGCDSGLANMCYFSREQKSLEILAGAACDYLAAMGTDSLTKATIQTLTPVNKFIW